MISTRYKIAISQRISRSRLKNHQFTIISNNCWGGEVYKDLGLAYLTPFIGLFLFPSCYIHLLENLDEYLFSELTFTNYSRYQLANDYRKQGVWEKYPIGLLKQQIEIHFMHYSSESEAREKWFRRLQRTNWQEEDIFIKFCDHDPASRAFFAQFEALKFQNKVCFTSHHHPEFPSCVWIKEMRDKPGVIDGGALYRVSQRYFDIVGWLNHKNGELAFPQRMIHQLLY